MINDKELQQLEITTKTTIKTTLKNLKEFDGPFDLLLQLVKDAKIDIKDIFLSNVTDQFLKYLEKLDEIDMDMASEFIEVAASLLEIKAKALLPKLPGENDEDDPEKKFVQRIEEYKLLKGASEELKKTETVGQFYKEPDNSTLKPQYIIKDMTLDGLLNAFSKMLNRIEKAQNAKDTQKEIKKEVHTVKQKIEYIKSVILQKKRTSFFDLFSEDFTKVEVISTFQAILELLKAQIISALQDVVFSDIIIVLKEGAELLINQKIEIDEGWD